MAMIPPAATSAAYHSPLCSIQSVSISTLPIATIPHADTDSHLHLLQHFSERCRSHASRSMGMRSTSFSITKSAFSHLHRRSDCCPSGCPAASGHSCLRHPCDVHHRRTDMQSFDTLSSGGLQAGSEDASSPLAVEAPKSTQPLGCGHRYMSAMTLAQHVILSMSFPGGGAICVHTCNNSDSWIHHLHVTQHTQTGLSTISNAI
jgi:hypothetical protein